MVMSTFFWRPLNSWKASRASSSAWVAARPGEERIAGGQLGHEGRVDGELVLQAVAGAAGAPVASELLVEEQLGPAPHQQPLAEAKRALRETGLLRSF
jgi:hypothetical protein